jgi:glycosyltransferase involved in cell wall biosynthesis
LKPTEAEENSTTAPVPPGRYYDRSSVHAPGPGVEGKFLRFDGERLYIRGMTYGTFAETELGMFPGRERVKEDFAAMSAVGCNTVRTYTVPEPDVLDLAEEAGLKLLMGVWWDDPRYLDPTDRDGWKKMTSAARAAVKETAFSYAGHPAVLGFVLGNEIPGPVVRWHGRRRVEGLLRHLYETGKEAAPEALFSYANYPTTQYLDTGFFDFDCFNVFLEDESDYRRYLAQLQVAAGDRPLILTEMGLDSGAGEERQANSLDWQLRAAAELGLAGACVFSWTDDWWVGGHKVEGWYFGVTRENREPKPALQVLEEHYRKKPQDCRREWPKASVIVCAYQAEDTIGECLQSLTKLNYPNYEVLVVDDGSTDATGEIARRFPVRLLCGGRVGLSGARNLGLEHADGEIVAYIDADAQADPEWLTYLALSLEAPQAAGAGGPNPVPPDDPPISQCVARAPGGPIHVLLDDESAEHVPGCNMAFWRERLLEIGGFDPVYHAAGDDVDACWKLLDLGYKIQFHASALVWHRRRNSVQAFWRQQVGYGKAEALVEGRHPDKFNDLGQASWRGVVYGPTFPLVNRRGLVYSGRFGDAPFQKLYGRQNHFNHLGTLAFSLGLGVLSLLGLGLLTHPVRASLPLVPDRLSIYLLSIYLLVLPVVILAALVLSYAAHGVRVARRERLRPTWRLGVLIGLLHLLPTVARAWGRLRAGRPSAFERAGSSSCPLRSARRGLFLTEGVNEVSREAFLEGLRDRLRAVRLRPKASSPWDEADITCNSILFWQVRMVSYEAWWGTLYLRLVSRLRPGRIAVPALGVASVFLWLPPLAGAGAFVGLLAVLLLEGWHYTRRVQRTLTTAPKKDAPDNHRSGTSC